MGKPFLHSLKEGELKQWLKSQGQSAFRAKQIEQWLWQHCVASTEQMSNLPKALQEVLERDFIVRPLELVKVENSSDGETTKYLWQLHDGKRVESVLIRAPGRKTVCVSSQVGCAMRCSFCASGKCGFVRNLDMAEIVSQVLAIHAMLLESGEKVSHVVYMGMGEPLQNYGQVVASIRALTERFGISRRRITLSTVGVIEGIRKLAREEVGVHLALSLHAPSQELRQKLLPFAKGVELGQLMQAVDEYRRLSGRDITYEYILIHGVNDRPEHARELIALLRSRGGCVNLIPYNPVPGLRFKRSTKEDIERFREILSKEGVNNTCRYTKGKDISAACGQLALDEKASC